MSSDLEHRHAAAMRLLSSGAAVDPLGLLAAVVDPGDSRLEHLASLVPACSSAEERREQRRFYLELRESGLSQTRAAARAGARLGTGKMWDRELARRAG